jgi:hypothetical protein
VDNFDNVMGGVRGKATPISSLEQARNLREQVDSRAKQLRLEESKLLHHVTNAIADVLSDYGIAAGSFYIESPHSSLSGFYDPELGITNRDENSERYWEVTRDKRLSPLLRLLCETRWGHGSRWSFGIRPDGTQGSVEYNWVPREFTDEFRHYWCDHA